jgi:hypothetical protein
MGPHREDLNPYQRTIHDFFIPNTLREELQKKAEATWQVMPSKSLSRIPDLVKISHAQLPNSRVSKRRNITVWYLLTQITTRAPLSLVSQAGFTRHRRRMVITMFYADSKVGFQTIMRLLSLTFSRISSEQRRSNRTNQRVEAHLQRRSCLCHQCLYYSSIR